MVIFVGRFIHILNAYFALGIIRESPLLVSLLLHLLKMAVLFGISLLLPGILDLGDLLKNEARVLDLIHGLVL